ncbi:hypothetical protein BDY19DRAFT_146916 [Irpex rosettiformis]|uniref:Uncharacterized protein n=1 Tax=Irpex rosettiformis TaxID=378272 RepID=A0ACB8U3E3_9APHY|nr:hypothetical protein BDY19DRAFT_146916 [Irpex rosettiformis]
MHLPTPGSDLDGTKVFDFLRERIKTPPEHILQLKNADVTRKRIIDTFKSHLIDNQDIEKGDAILFYFSGHGTRLKAPVGWTVVEEKNVVDAQDDMVEAIVPYDESVQYADDDHPTCSIPDRTLATLLKLAARNHGNNITVVLDCCHSSSGTRGNISNLLNGEELTVRALPGSDLSPLPPYLDDDLLLLMHSRCEEPEAIDDRLSPSLDKKLAEAVKQSLSGVLDVGSASARKRGTFQALSANHVLIAACKPNEQALGGTGGGGILTALWLCALEAKLHPRTLAQVMKYIHKQLSAVCGSNRESWPQQPQCEGVYHDRLVFEETMMKADHFNAKFEEVDARLMVDAGEVHGVRPGTVFEIYELNKSLEETKLGEAEAQEVYAHRCALRLKPGHRLELQPKIVYTAAIIHEIQLRYTIAGVSIRSAHTFSKFRTSLSRTPSVVEVPEEMDADLTLCFEVDGTVTLRRLDPLLSALAVP